jgi:hypothetical protein
MRKSRKLIAILAVLALLVTMLPVGTAFAATDYKALRTPTVNDDAVQELGTVLMDITPGSVDGRNDTVTLRLPSDFKFVYDGDKNKVMKQADWDQVVGTSEPANYKNWIEVPERYAGNVNYLTPGDVHVKYLDENEIQLSIDSVSNSVYGEGLYILLHLGEIYIDSGYDGDVYLIADAPSESGLSDGKVIVGRVSSAGKVSVEVTNVPTFSNDTTNDPIKIRIKEDVAGALEDGDESLKFTLPSAFVWMKDFEVSTIWGDPGLETRLENADKSDGWIDIDDDELIINLPKGYATSKATCIELTVNIEVDDETKAKAGDVVAKVRGKSDIDVNEVIVAKYGEYETTIDVKNVPTIYAGMTDQVIGDIVIKESVKESLIEGRTIILTLPSNAKWGDMDEDSDKGVRLQFEGFPGTDGRSAKWKVIGKSTDAAELTLEEMEVVVEPGFTGDLEVEVSGTAGLSGKFTVAKVVTPVSIEAASVPEVKIGTTSEAGDLIITETMAGAIEDDKDLILDLPEGVRFAGTPKVEVVEGDLDIDEGGVRTKADGSTDDNQLVIPVDGKSSEASKIKVSGIKYLVDRTVPEGDITVKVKGDAVVQVNDITEIKDYYGESNISTSGVVSIDGKEAFTLVDNKIFPQTSTAAKTVNAKVTTPAPEGQKATVVFKVGDTKFTVNGAEQTMDVAPYVKNGRTYVPVRYSAQAVGVAAENILFSGGKVTLIKGDKVVQFTIGSNVMLINGVAVTMDVKAEITSGRTMLPFRWVAQALGAQVNWDPTEQTVTMTL